jgi:hypothetical protein
VSESFHRHLLNPTTKTSMTFRTKRPTCTTLMWNSASLISSCSLPIHPQRSALCTTMLCLPAWLSDSPHFRDAKGIMKNEHLGLREYGEPYIKGPIPQAIKRATQDGTPVSYAEFPLFETRLRELRQYIDSVKPRNFRQLWKDNRDSLSYWTFWYVILFGVITVLLSLFSLTVGIAQTMASFRALALAAPVLTPPAV